MASLRTAYEHDPQPFFCSNIHDSFLVRFAFCKAKWHWYHWPAVDQPVLPDPVWCFHSHLLAGTVTYLIQHIFLNWLVWDWRLLFWRNRICCEIYGCRPDMSSDVAFTSSAASMFAHIQQMPEGSAISSNHCNCVDVVDRCSRTWSNRTVALAWTS